MIPTTMKNLAALNNTMTRALRIQYPIISAPMEGISGIKLATAVGLHGGLGFIDYKQLHLDNFSSTGLRQFSNNILNHTNLNHHLGFRFDKRSLSDIVESSISEVIKSTNIRNIWINYADFKNNIDYSILNKIPNINLFLQVNSIGQMKDAYANGARVIVLRGRGSSGFEPTDEFLLLKDFIKEAKDFLDTEKYIDYLHASNTFLVAEGGINSGEGIARCLKLGASGVCLGTRFASTTESNLSDDGKYQIVATTHGQCVLQRYDDGRRFYSGTGVERINRIDTVEVVMNDLISSARVSLVDDDNEWSYFYF